MTAQGILAPVRPCAKCGATERNKRGDCKACIKARSTAWIAANQGRVKARRAAQYKANAERENAASSAWYSANSDKVKAAAQIWQAANPDKVKASIAARYAANPDKAKANAAAWKAANPDAVKIIKQNRRAKKQAAGGTLSTGLAAKLFNLQKGKCPCCKQPLGDDYHLDHIVPLALGGANEDWNIQLLRQRCNNQKYIKHPVEFMQSRGFLL